MIVHGDEKILALSHVNFGEFILDQLRKAKPNDICLHNCKSGDKLTFNEFVQYAVSLAKSLVKLKVRRGDIVMVAGEPRVNFLPTTLAVVLTGATYVPIELECGRAVLAHKLNLTRPKYVICSRLFWEEYSDMLKGLDFIDTLICFDNIEDIKLSVEDMVSRDVDVMTFEPADVRGDTDVATIMFSSGTTGLSKGVALTHYSCIARADANWYHDFELVQICGLQSPLSAPFATFLIYSFICSGKQVVYPIKMDQKILKDYQIDTIAIMPALFEQMITEAADDNDFRTLKTIYSVFWHLPSTIAEKVKQRYPNVNVLQRYGTTETAAITVQKPSNVEAASVGVAAPGASIKVVDVETRIPLGPNQRGEICVRSPCLMKGYLGADSPYLDEQGFFLTGDLGYYDEHKCFYLVDRLKDIICYKGHKVPPNEVEAVLLSHPAVREVAVVGKPAGVYGALPTAFVVLRPGAQATQSELVQYVDKEVNLYTRLRGGVRFVSELPKNSRLKILRRQLTEMLEQEDPHAL